MPGFFQEKNDRKTRQNENASDEQHFYQHGSDRQRSNVQDHEEKDKNNRDQKDDNGFCFILSKVVLSENAFLLSGLETDGDKTQFDFGTIWFPFLGRAHFFVLFSSDNFFVQRPVGKRFGLISRVVRHDLTVADQLPFVDQ